MLTKWLPAIVAAAALGAAGFSTYTTQTLGVELGAVRTELAATRKQVAALEIRTRPTGCTRAPGDPSSPQLC